MVSYCYASQSNIQLYEADFNCFNYFIFGKSAMDSLTKNDYLPEELFSQKGSTTEGRDPNIPENIEITEQGDQMANQGAQVQENNIV